MSNRRSKQSGYVLVTVAAMLFILLGFAALAVDVGMMYGAHTSAQRAADAGALAGAFTFSEAGPGATPADLQTGATTAAKNTAALNTIMGTPIDPAKVDVAFIPDVTNRLIQVDVRHQIPTFFAGVLGYKNVTIGATAFAEASMSPTGAECVKPWFIPNSILAKTVDTSDTTGCGTCSTLDPFLPPALPPLDGRNLVATSAKDIGWKVKNYIEGQTRPVPSPPGTAVRIKPGNPQNSLAPGEFFAIQLSNDANQGGGDVYRDNIATCGEPSTIRCWDWYSVKTGNMIGPTKQGVESLIGPVGDSWSGFVNDLPTYNDNDNQHLSHQTVLAPVWDVCSTICQSGMKLTGTNVQIQVIGFAVIFIDGVQGNDVMAHLVNVQPCTASSTGGQPGPLAIPLRLVRTN